MFTTTTPLDDAERKQLEALKAHQTQVRVHNDAAVRVSRHSAALSRAEQDEAVAAKSRETAKARLLAALRDA